MLIEDYPPQEIVPETVLSFHRTLMNLGEGAHGSEHRYGDDPSQSLLVYPCAEPHAPVLMFLHGGGWTNGYKEEMAFLARPLNQAGIAFVSSGYRLAPGAVFPANVQDVAEAVAKVYGLADVYGYDRDVLFVGGHSAGGHLASLVAACSDWTRSHQLPPDTVKGCLPISATFDFTPGSGASARPRFLGEVGRFNEVLASPLFRLSGDAPPFLIATASGDFPHLKLQAEKFAMVARWRGVLVDTMEIADATHLTGLLSAGREGSPWLTAATRWMSALTKARS